MPPLTHNWKLKWPVLTHSILGVFVLLCFLSLGEFTPPGELVLDEIFHNWTIESSVLRWRDEPKNWSIEEGKLKVEPDPETDYWQKTYYKPDISRAYGAQLGIWMEGDIIVETAFTLRPANQFDQAGIIMRASDTHWVKAGIEYSDGAPHLSIVLTNGTSTWAIQPWPWNINEQSVSLSLRLYRIGDDIVAEAFYGPSTDGHWKMFAIGRVEGLSAGALTGLSVLAPTSNREDTASATFEYMRVWRCPTKGSCFHHCVEDGENKGQDTSAVVPPLPDEL